MKPLLISLGILFAIDLSGQSERRELQLSGSISEKYQIKMFLSIQNNKVLGYYYYEEYKTKILLEGYQNGATLTLKESPDLDPDFHIGFNCDLKGKTLIGNWLDNNRRKNLEVKLLVVSDRIVQIKENIIKVEGIYENIANSNLFSQSLRLQNISNELFFFEITVGTANCTGYLRGMISLIDFKNGSYSDNLCKKLQFTKDSDLLIVSEEICKNHGAGCGFGGKYRKQ